MRLIFPGGDLEDLAAILLNGSDEAVAILLADVDGDRLVVTDRHIVPVEAYSERTKIGAQVKPEFLVPLIQRARSARKAMVFCHTHPGDDGVPVFSRRDDTGEKALQAMLDRRVPDIAHCALVISRNGFSARILGRHELVLIQSIGRQVLVRGRIGGAHVGDERWDRQVRAFGAEGQAAIAALRVAIVGCGGTGSVVAEQLAHLGVRNFTLVDPDLIESTNLNRVVGSSEPDIGAAKVLITDRMIRRINPEAVISAVAGDVRDWATAKLLTQVDAIFSCTDSHASRVIVNQIAYQYLIPAFDMGISIVVQEGSVTRITGRSQMLAPGLGCLVCGNMLDWKQVRQEMMSDTERTADRYLIGHHEPQPAVISLNMTIASLSVTMFMAAFTSVPAEGRLLFYDGVKGTLRSARIDPDPTCIVCSGAGALSKLDAWPLPTRPAQQS